MRKVKSAIGKKKIVEQENCTDKVTRKASLRGKVCIRNGWELGKCMSGGRSVYAVCTIVVKMLRKGFSWVREAQHRNQNG